MRKIAAIAVAITASAVVYVASASGQSGGDASPIYGIKIPPGYRDWRLISVKQLMGAGGKLKQLRAQLGNDIAIKAFRKGTLPFPDGTIIAALHWNEASSDADNKVLAEGFPGAALESSFAGSAVNVQFMIKDSKNYAATGRLGIRRLHERQSWRRSAAPKVLPLPRASERSRLRFYALRTDAMN